MKKNSVHLGLVLLLFVFFYFSSPTHGLVGEAMGGEKLQMYTAYNIWRLPVNSMKCINYKKGKDFIPAGTKVNEIKIKTVKKNNYGTAEKAIYFKIEGDSRAIQIGFSRRFHPGKKVHDYFSRLFTSKPFEVLSEGMSKNELYAIQNGILVEGMSKNAVLVSYGYPPEHATKSIEEDTWIYWMSTMKRKRVCFDENDRTIRCEKRASPMERKPL